jgi:predicted nucleotidyltransferase
MRLTPQQVDLIRRTVAQWAGAGASVRLFGSRVDDSAKGGDVDLLIDCPQPVDGPAMLAARLGARISRAIGGRKVDVLLAAPNLQEGEIHRIARARGILL